MPGMFGLTPQEVQQQQMQAAAQQNYQIANMGSGIDAPFARARYGISQGAGMLAGAAAEGMGMVNQQVEQAKQIQQLQQGIDLTTPEGAMAAAKRFSDAGQSEIASKLVIHARDLSLKQAQTKEATAKSGLEEAQTQYAGWSDDMKLADAIAKAKPGSEQSRVLNSIADKKNLQYQDEGDKIARGMGFIPNSSEYIDFMKKWSQARINQMGKAGVQVSIDQHGENAFATEVGKLGGKEYADLQKAGIASSVNIANIERLRGYLKDIQTGKLTPLGTSISSAAASLGLNVDKNLGNKEAAESLTNQIALTLRSTADGAGMPGSLSDSDREFLRAMAPGISKSKNANEEMINAYILLQKRHSEVAKLSRDYVKKNKTIDGFQEELQKYADEHPLFKNTSMAPTIVDRLKRY